MKHTRDFPLAARRGISAHRIRTRFVWALATALMTVIGLFLAACGGGGGGSSPTEPRGQGSILLQTTLEGLENRVSFEEITVFLDGEEIGQAAGGRTVFLMVQASKDGVRPGTHTVRYRIDSTHDGRTGQASATQVVFWTPSPGAQPETFTEQKSFFARNGASVSFQVNLPQ